MHVDGFRFDLASILTRDRRGNPQPYAPILEGIGDDPVLANVKLIAEPWDAVGLYQVGNFWPLGRRGRSGTGNIAILCDALSRLIVELKGNSPPAFAGQRISMETKVPHAIVSIL